MFVMFLDGSIIDAEAEQFFIAVDICIAQRRADPWTDSEGSDVSSLVNFKRSDGGANKHGNFPAATVFRITARVTSTVVGNIRLE